ncbi:MAG: hypothetical protein CVV44_23415 [Spirochaetae bacterium HGW-Spirochaetae-1]|jgi:predicted dehydrogenase|nr:MAG: hypothetical protein CVV44_23415 [Spirochaetae bacterium HGW-Spirochaetae-1]
MQKTTPAICFIGSGTMARRHSATLKKLYPHINLFYADIDPEQSRRMNDDLKGKGSYASCEEALQSGDFQIAFITTPHAWHAELAVMAAKNGKDIIIEKPVARNGKELNSILKAVTKYGVRCAVSENYFFKPFLKPLKKYISAGLIGDVLFVELNKVNRDSIQGWRTDPVLMGGGALLEGGVHWVNLLVSLVGADPVDVIAFKPEVSYETNIPVEDSLMVTARFSNGVTGKLLHSWRIPNSLKGMAHSKIYGTEGVITFESNGLFISVSGKKRRLCVPNPLDFLGFKAMHRSFIQNYMDGKPWEPSLERITMEFGLVEAAYRSLKTKKLESIKTV